MRIRTVLIVAAAVVAAACSNERKLAEGTSPTAPRAVAAPVDSTGSVSGPAIVDYPGRSEAIDFRTQLETKYVTGLGRRPAQVFVDQEGEVVWIGEYQRYRVNGCDHNTATQNVMVQIDGATAPPICSVRAFPETAQYPPRDHVMDFRRQLGSKYQAMGRSAQSAVDPDGAATWISEYDRYRTSGCDHQTATQKVMAQIDGQPASETCLVSCFYRVSSASTSLTAAGGTFTADIERTSGACDYLAVSESEWISLARPVSGSGRGVLTFNVANNTGVPRSGSIRFQWPGGSTYLTITQGSLNVAFQFFDPALSTSPTTECQLRTTSTVCRLQSVTQNLPNPVATYSWHVEYAYGGTKVRTQTTSSPTFSFTESCGVSDPNGSPIPLLVRMTAIDTAGNAVTLTSGQGGQPALQLRAFSCQ